MAVAELKSSFTYARQRSIKTSNQIIIIIIIITVCNIVSIGLTTIVASCILDFCGGYSLAQESLQLTTKRFHIF